VNTRWMLGGVLVALATACGSGSSSVPVDDAGGGTDDLGKADAGPADTGPADTGPMLGEYPEGPYGNRRGNILANLSWEGYVNPTGEGLSSEQPYGPTSMQALRAGGRYALVHVSEFY